MIDSLKRAELGATVGGRIAGTKIPRSRKSAAARKAISDSPRITGIIGVSEYPVSNPIARSSCRTSAARAITRRRNAGSRSAMRKAARAAADHAGGNAVV